MSDDHRTPGNRRWASTATATARATTPKDDPPRRRGLHPDYLADAPTVIAEGQQIAEQGIRYVLDGIIPNYGMVGFLVAFAKCGKSSFGQALAAAVAMGREFLGRATQHTRVLIIAAEDPSEYTAYLSRTLDVAADRLTFYRGPILLNAAGLDAITATIADGQYGLVVLSSWQALIRGLVENENDNAAGVAVVERVKIAARASGVPWLIDAHSGKGESQDDDADPTMALRGASAAAGAADYLLSLRYANGTFGTQRRLSGKGRFVNLAPLTLEYDVATGTYSCLGSTKDAASDTTWRLMTETGALSTTPRTLAEIAQTMGMIDVGEKLSGNKRSHLNQVLSRPEVFRRDEPRRGGKTKVYWLPEVM